MIYPATAFIVGGLWFAALYPFCSRLALGGQLFPFDLLAMCLASLTVAVTCKRLITGASCGRRVLFSLLLPCYGAFIFGVYLGLFMTAQNLWSNGRLPDGEAIQLPLLCVLYGGLGLSFVSIPMGFLSQYLMEKAASAAG
jgi:hypothetical protein